MKYNVCEDYLQYTYNVIEKVLGSIPTLITIRTVAPLQSDISEIVVRKNFKSQTLPDTIRWQLDLKQTNTSIKSTVIIVFFAVIPQNVENGGGMGNMKGRNLALNKMISLVLRLKQTNIVVIKR